MKAHAALLAAAALVSGCYPGGLLPAVVATNGPSGAAVSTAPPPPPRVECVPEGMSSGYVWQPGYWESEDDRWTWIPGRHVPAPPGFVWSSPRWEQLPDGCWRLVPGRWKPVPLERDSAGRRGPDAESFRPGAPVLAEGAASSRPNLLSGDL